MPRILSPTPTTGLAPSHSPPDERFAPGYSLARTLGWFSVGLGAAELLAPTQVARLTGINSTSLIQSYGVRELICGIGILTSQRPAGWMWGRVVGDAADLATLATATSDADPGTHNAACVVAVAAVTACDLVCAAQLTAAAMLEG